MVRLGQEEPALDRAEQCKSQVVRIGGGGKFAALLHPGEPLFGRVLLQHKLREATAAGRV